MSKISSENNFGITAPAKVIDIDMSYIETMVTESIDLEVINVSEEDIKHVTSRSIELYYTYNTFNMVSLAGSQKLSNLVLENAAFRNFIFNLTNRILFNLNSKNSYLNNLVAIIAESLSFLDKENSILNEAVKQSICEDKERIKERLISDKWLITLLLIKLYVRKTLFFQNIFES